MKRDPINRETVKFTKRKWDYKMPQVRNKEFDTLRDQTEYIRHWLFKIEATLDAVCVLESQFEPDDKIMPLIQITQIERFAHRLEAFLVS